MRNTQTVFDCKLNGGEWLRIEDLTTTTIDGIQYLICGFWTAYKDFITLL